MSVVQTYLCPHTVHQISSAPTEAVHGVWGVHCVSARDVRGDGHGRVAEEQSEEREEGEEPRPEQPLAAAAQAEAAVQRHGGGEVSRQEERDCGVVHP